MRFTIPQNDNQAFPYYVLKVHGGSDVNIAFDIVKNEKSVGRRRYCNKVLVHECVPVVESDPLALIRAEFLATADPCCKYFNVFKTSEETEESGDNEPTIILEPTEESGDAEDLIGSVVVSFLSNETCCLPLRQSYRLWGYLADESRILLSQGNLYITPCSSSTTLYPVTGGDCGPACWTDVNW